MNLADLAVFSEDQAAAIAELEQRIAVLEAKAPTKKAPTKKAPTKKAPTKKAPTKKAPTKR